MGRAPGGLLLTPDVVSAIRLAALCSAAKVADLPEAVLCRCFRALAAGITLPRHRPTARWRPSEMIILATP